jgi:hypothetical protein
MAGKAADMGDAEETEEAQFMTNGLDELGITGTEPLGAPDIWARMLAAWEGDGKVRKQ